MARKRPAESIREAYLDAALEAYESALMQGLCHEGAWECAVGAIRSLDVDAVLEELSDREDAARRRMDSMP